MRTKVFTTASGRHITRAFDMDEPIPRFVIVEGERAEYDFAASCPLPSASLNAFERGHVSEAMGVHPNQCAESTAVLEHRTGLKAGVHFEHNASGALVTHSREARKRCMKAIGLHDKDGGYGDG